MMCQFQVYSKVNQLYIYLLYFQIIFPYKPLQSIQFSVLYSKFLLVIYFISYIAYMQKFLFHDLEWRWQWLDTDRGRLFFSLFLCLLPDYPLVALCQLLTHHVFLGQTLTTMVYLQATAKNFPKILPWTSRSARTALNAFTFHNYQHYSDHDCSN